MSSTSESLLGAVLALATCIWVGGYVAIAVVARAATATLDPAMRIALFRKLGRSYFWVGTPALLVALISGGLLVRNHDLDALLAWAIALTGLLVASFAVAVAQARRMTVLRRQLIEAPADTALVARVRRVALLAAGLRAVLGVLSVALVVLGAFLAN